MFSKEERKKIHEEFWQGLKRRMNKHANVNGKRVNWLRYPIRMKEMYVRMTADNRSAIFSIEFQSTDNGILALLWEQMIELKMVLELEMGNDGDWMDETYNLAGQPICAIRWELENVNIYETSDAPVIYDFFEAKLLAFDRFYEEYKEVLYALMK
jgi:hypothetical protein